MNAATLNYIYFKEHLIDQTTKKINKCQKIIKKNIITLDLVKKIYKFISNCAHDTIRESYRGTTDLKYLCKLSDLHELEDLLYRKFIDEISKNVQHVDNVQIAKYLMKINNIDFERTFREI
jgi:hypothetical protein